MAMPFNCFALPDTFSLSEDNYEQYAKINNRKSYSEDLIDDAEYGTSEVDCKNKENYIAKIFLPDQVHKILNEFGFVQNDVALWKNPIEVPIGVKTDLF